MEKMKQLVIGEEGQSLVEYGLILGLVSVGLTIALTAMKGSVEKVFNGITTKLNGIKVK